MIKKSVALEIDAGRLRIEDNELLFEDQSGRRHRLMYVIYDEKRVWAEPKWEELLDLFNEYKAMMERDKIRGH